MIELIYLESGQEANLIKKIDDNNFLVEPIIIHTDYDGNEYDESGSKIVVSKIFKAAPIEKKHEDYLAIFDKIACKNEELRSIEIELSEAKNELRTIQSQKTNIGKLIYNRSELKNAKRITVFTKDGIEPQEMSEKNKKYLKLSIEFNVIDGQEKAWSSKYYGDSWGSGDILDPEYGFIIDATDDEILEIAKERVRKDPKRFLTSWRLSRTPDIYLTEELIKEKEKAVKETNEKKVEDLSKKIKNYQDEIAEITKVK